MISNINIPMSGQFFGGDSSYMQDFVGGIPPIDIGYYNAFNTNPMTYQAAPQQPLDQMDPYEYQRYMLQQQQQQMSPGQQMDPYEYQRQMQQQYQQYHEQMDPYEHQRYMQQQYQQQLNPQAEQVQQQVQPPQDTGMASQLRSGPPRFRNPDFYSEQRYLGYGAQNYGMPNFSKIR